MRIISITGEKIQGLIPEIARLRMEVFKEYPFLYIGDPAYEEKYLAKFSKMENAIVVLSFDQDAIVGVSTGYPFTYEAPALQDVLRKSGRNPSDYFCFGESVLRKEYRGQGIGKKFFEERQAFVKNLKTYPYVCFYTSFRPKDDPKRPPDYRPLAPFWQSQGFSEHPELVGTVSYQEIGEKEESPKKMVFWIKKVSVS